MPLVVEDAFVESPSLLPIRRKVCYDHLYGLSVHFSGAVVTRCTRLNGRRSCMRWTSHPGRTLIFVLLLALIPGATVAQTSGTPESSPEAPQSIWQTLGGVEEAIVRTWGDIPPGANNRLFDPAERLPDRLGGFRRRLRCSARLRHGCARYQRQQQHENQCPARMAGPTHA